MSDYIRVDEYGDPDATLVEVEKQGKFMTLTLSNGRFNGYTHRMMRQIDEAVLKARFDTEVEVIIITGAGKMFCAGADINMLQKSDPVGKYYFCLHANETLSRLEQTPKLTIAALNGHCIGGGLEIAMACDLRVARQDAGKLGLPEVSLGVLPGTGGTQRLARMIGKHKAIELMITGRNFSFEEGKDLGLVTEILACEEGDNFLDKVREYGSQFTTPTCASMAVGHIKRSVQSGAEVPLEYGLAMERELQAKLFASDDAKEGLTAFVERRKPNFQGK